MVDQTQSPAVRSGPKGGVVVAKSGNVLSNVMQIYAQPSVQRSLPMLVALLAVVVTIIVYLILQKPEMTTLYASLPESEKARVVDSLKNSGIEVMLDPTTGEVVVPVADYHRSRMSLAAQGLPSSTPDGYDSLNDMPLGTSRSVENMRLKQSQEVELARSINEIDSVLSARVHLALPEKSVFVRNSPGPTASVFLQLAKGRTLSAQQVQAIVHLVSSSVPDMTREGVTVVDQNGRLLSNPNGDEASGMSDTQLEYRMRLENIYRTRVESLVTPMVGAGNVSAQVNIDVDFTRSEVTEERVDPTGNALRSEQTTMDQESNAKAMGIPGAVANTPPAQASVNPASGMNAKSDGANASGDLRTRSSSEVRNYEVSRRVSTTQAPNAQIRQIHVAVLVRDPMVADAETGEMRPQPLPPESLLAIENLVKSTVGLDEERGDSLIVSSQPFVSTLEGVPKTWHDQPWMKDLARQMITVMVFGVVALGIVRPLLNRLLVPVGSSVPGEVMMREQDDIDLDKVEVAEGETLEDIKAKLKPKKQTISAEMLDTANTYDDKVAIIRMIVADEAGRVSNVFKAMMKRDLDLIN